MRIRTGVSLAVWACLFAAGADAGEVRKCEHRDGSHSYVSGACPAGTRQAWVRDVEPEPVDADRLRERQTALNRWQQRSRVRGSSGGGSRPSQTSRNNAAKACETAKRRRNEVRDRDWYTLTLEQLRTLDDRVARACR
ncbi:hypothetical protein M2650_08935 [Luteimonas sp. SX5]|uniref:DUF4124 domain-containing protein n=1 Tax=Luteimonas galliterrae TaxID=2940486 RepID=A0ABT0MJF6_9GAMM|nr:hypothetical protein [Luteimonas galliterrae]MCL1634753.1 hypothetical protein [Luteimonas galliterrae]